MLGAVAGQTLEVRVDEVRVGAYGLTVAGGWSTSLNDRLGVGDGESRVLAWELDADAGLGRDRDGREVSLAPFLGVLGMPPPEPGVHPTGPPRRWGGNIDCKELVAGTTLYLPISVDGALFSAGDGHARQGDGEVSSHGDRVPARARAADAPAAGRPRGWRRLSRARRTPGSPSASTRTSTTRRPAPSRGCSTLMERELGLERRDALALASVVVDLRVTQIVNGVQGVHAVLRDDAIR